jgi:hypothetical protein
MSFSAGCGLLPRLLGGRVCAQHSGKCFEAFFIWPSVRAESPDEPATLVVFIPAIDEDWVTRIDVAILRRPSNRVTDVPGEFIGPSRNSVDKRLWFRSRSVVRRRNGMEPFCHAARYSLRGRVSQPEFPKI